MKVDYRKLYGDSELLDTFLNQSAGEVLKELRKERKLSLAEVENRTEMFSKQTLSKYSSSIKVSRTLKNINNIRYIYPLI